MNKPNRETSMTIQTATKDYLTAQELAGWLRVSLRTIANLRQRNILPCIKLGRLVRFRRDEVEEALREFTVHGMRVGPAE